MKKKKATKIIIALVIIALVLVIVFVPWPSFSGPASNVSNQSDNASLLLNETPSLPGNDSAPANTETSESCTLDYEAENASEVVWNNLTWSPEEKGNETLYKTALIFSDRNGLSPINVFVYLHKNPAKTGALANVTAMPKNATYVSYDNSAMECDDTLLASTEMGYFMGLLGISAKGAITDPSKSKDPEMIKSCKDANENVTVVVVQKTSASCNPMAREEGNCIIVDAGSSCNIVEAAEGYILSLIKTGMAEGKIRAA